MTSKVHPNQDRIGMLAGLAAATLIALLPAPVVAQTGGIPGVVAPGVESELVQEGFTFTEGPVGTADGGLYFSDIRVNRVFHLDAAGKITVARENTNGTNGIALTKEGDLLFAEGGGKRISKRGRDGTISTVTDSFEGKPFLSPNDLLVDARGGLYITDPGPRPVVPGRPTYVFYLPAGAKEPIAIDTQVPRPNGLTLTRDGRTLSPQAPKVAPTAWRSIATTASTSQPSPACRCSTLRAVTSARSNRLARARMSHLPDRTSARFTSRRARASIASRRWHRDPTASASDKSACRIGGPAAFARQSHQKQAAVRLTPRLPLGFTLGRQSGPPGCAEF
jgi:hypothetical protein